MKKIFIMLTLLLVSSLIVGCSNNEDKALKKEQDLKVHINQLNKLAASYYDEGKLDKAIKTYEDTLKLKDSIKVRKKIDTIEEELDNVHKAKDFTDKLKSIEENRLRSGISLSGSDMEYTMKDLKDLIGKFEQIDTTQDNKINAYINEVKEKQFNGIYNYQYIKKDVNNKIYEDGGATDALSSVDSSFGAFASANFALDREWIVKSIDNILSIPFPSKYNM